MRFFAQSTRSKDSKGNVSQQVPVRLLPYMLLVSSLLAVIGVARPTSGGNEASPQLVWSANERVEESLSACHRPAVAIDSAGGRYAVWADERRSNGEVFFNYAPPGGGWGLDHNITTDTTDRAQLVPDIAVDDAGNAYAVWEDNRGTDKNVYFAFRPAGGTWGADIQVNDEPDTGQQLVPTIAVDGAGNACVVWIDGRNNTGNGNWDIYADCRPVNGTWGQDRKV